MEGVKDLVKVLTTSNGKVALETAAKTVSELGKVGENKLKLVEEEGLIGGLVRVMKMDGESYRVAREDAVTAIYWIACHGSAKVSKGLLKHEGLIAGFVEILGRKRSEYKLARENALAAISNIACGADAQVLKGLFKHEGLIAGLVEILGLKGSEYLWSRENAVFAITNIAYGTDEVKAGLFHFPQLMSRIEAIIRDANLNGTDTKNMALKLKKKIEHMGGGGQSNPPSTQSLGSSTAGSVRMEKELAEMRTEQATMKSNLETVRTEQAAMKSCLTSVQDSLFRVEKALATLTSTLAPTETLDLNDISTTLSNPPPFTDSTGNNKRSNLAILADNQASFNHTLKKVKKEKDDVSRSLSALEDAETCTVCLVEKRGVLFLPCGHLVCCGECSERVDECPMCRKVIRKRKTVFM
jgi:hypothetical protein